MDGWIERMMHGCIGVRMDGRTNGWIDKWMNRRMDRRMDGRSGGWEGCTSDTQTVDRNAYSWLPGEAIAPISHVA